MKNIPAQRRIMRAKKNRLNSSNNYFWLVLILISIALIWFFVAPTHFWNGKDKLALVSLGSDSNVEVFVFDPVLKEETSFTIPASTEVNVARNLGTMRIKNVWQLGINEHLGGKLLSETVTNNFSFINFLWSETNPKDMFKFVFKPGSTNISFVDRLAIVFFTLQVKNTGKLEIDIARNLYLEKAKLTDGETGYRIPGSISARLTVYFSDYAFQSNNIRFFIKDGTAKVLLYDIVFYERSALNNI